MSAQIGWKIEYLRNGLTSLAIWDRINRLIALSKSPSISLPLQGTPGSTVFSNTPDGKPKQARRYASDGYPETDVDYDHTHHGHDSPHAHDWGRPVQGGRGPWRPIIPTDPVHPGY